MSEIQPEVRTADLGDAVIRYLDYKSQGPPLVLLHATGFLPELWHPVARQLAGSFRVIAPYMCHYREADPEDGGLSWKQIASDLVSLLSQAGLTGIYAAGHSMGGAVAVIAAGALGLQIEKMVLIEPIILPEALYGFKIGVKDHPLASKSIRRKNYWKDRDELRRYLESKQLFARWDREVLDLYIRCGAVETPEGGIRLACHPEQEAALFMGSMAFNPWPVISGVKCPVLVIEGEHTENRGFIDFRRAAETFPDGTYRLLRDAGHLIPMEKPGETAMSIKSFIEQ